MKIDFMETMFGLKTSTIEKINKIFAAEPAVIQVILYGSRAKGNYRNGSDIDLVIESEEMTLGQLFRIENELDDLLLPYRIDLSLLHTICDQDLLDHINRVGILFYEKASIHESIEGNMMKDAGD